MARPATPAPVGAGLRVSFSEKWRCCWDSGCVVGDGGSIHRLPRRSVARRSGGGTALRGVKPL